MTYTDVPKLHNTENLRRDFTSQIIRKTKKSLHGDVAGAKTIQLSPFVNEF